MTTGEKARTSGNIRLLPVQVRPRAGEGIRSFIARLAHANHLKPAFLLNFLREPTDHRGLPSWSRLAAITKRDPDALRLTLETRHCLECGTPMPPTDILGRRALRCSQRCRQRAHRKRYPTRKWRQEPCRICGSLMKVRNGQRRPLCSSACRRAAYLERQQRRTQQPDEAPLEVQPKPPRACPICEGSMPPRTARSRRRTCSQRCRQSAYRWRAAPLLPRLTPPSASSMPTRPCEICEQPLPPGPQQAIRRTCSHRCRQKAYRWRVNPPKQSQPQQAAPAAPPNPPPEVGTPPPSTLTCTVCTGPLPAGRGQATRRTCSHRCRQKAYRQRRSIH